MTKQLSLQLTNRNLPPTFKKSDPFVRWARFVEITEGCWLWIGSKNAWGYGSFKSFAGRYAHRFSYSIFKGPIPEGHMLDHLCRNPGCVNPRHLEPVTSKENCHRGLNGPVLCPHGILGIEKCSDCVKEREKRNKKFLRFRRKLFPELNFEKKRDKPKLCAHGKSRRLCRDCHNSPKIGREKNRHLFLDTCPHGIVGRSKCISCKKSYNKIYNKAYKKVPKQKRRAVSQPLDTPHPREGDGMKVTDPFVRFAQKVEITDSCWNWTASLNHCGYGTLKVSGKNKFAHRLSYVFFKGDIPPGLTIDHLCRNRACVNPNHLEPVTHWENMRRGLIRPIICPHGVRGIHSCPKCKPILRQQSYRKANNIPPEQWRSYAPRTPCTHGFKRKIDCRNCRNQKARNFWARKKQRLANKKAVPHT